MANITVSDLYINGTKMPDPALEGVTVNREKIWSSNTGRTTSGEDGGHCGGGENHPEDQVAHSDARPGGHH